MADRAGKFRGPTIRPVGTGRMSAQQPNPSGSAKKLASQLTDLDNTKAKRLAEVVYLTPDDSPYSVTEEDEVIIGNTNGGPIDIRLPSIEGQNGRLLTIKKWSNSVNPLGILPFNRLVAGADTVDQASLRSMNGADRAAVQLRADEARKDWIFVASYGTVV